MKAIILAAGRGKRMVRYGKDRPKGMLQFNGKSLIEYQIDSLRRAGIGRIIIVTGYKRECFTYPDVQYYHNPDYLIGNMIESLMCARDEFDEDLLVCYADLIYTTNLVRKVTDKAAEIAVAVDPEWRDYWMMRYGTTEADLETLAIKDDAIVELGRPVETSEGIQCRYIGVVKFSTLALNKTLDLYDIKRLRGENWWSSGNDFQNGYLTDLLQELIEEGISIRPVYCPKEWLEFDNDRDYENALHHLEMQSLSRIFRLDD